jgi:hypothetical protein
MYIDTTVRISVGSVLALRKLRSDIPDRLILVDEIERQVQGSLVAVADSERRVPAEVDANVLIDAPSTVTVAGTSTSVLLKATISASQSSFSNSMKKVLRMAGS